MILPVQNYSKNNIKFANKPDNEELKKHPVLMENNFKNRMSIGWDKFSSAMIEYPVRGFKGSIKANFYEFLTMGIIPYLAGSATLIAVFNVANKYFSLFDAKGASKLGRKMGLGVIFYGLAKNISKDFVTRPVKWLTGVDTEEPYVKIQCKLPEHKNDADIVHREYHKVLESVEFPYWNLKYGDPAKGQSRNEWYDKIAKKNGLGSNLKDSDQEVQPRVKEIAVKTNFAKTFSSYLWAGVGVGIALQDCWDNFFESGTWKFWKVKDFIKTIGSFGTNLWKGAKSFILGPENAKGIFAKHSGKFFAGTAALSTIIGVANVLVTNNRPSKLDSADVIEKNRKYVVN